MIPPQHPSPRLSAILQALLVTMLWSSSWVLIKIGLQDGLPPLTFAGLRYTIAFLCLIPFVLLSSSGRTSLKGLTGRDWGSLALLGVVYYSLTQGSMILALASLPVNTVSLLLNLTPVFVGLIGIFFLGEHPSIPQWIGISLAAAGVMIYFTSLALPAAQLAGLVTGVLCMLLNVAASLLSRGVNRHRRFPPLLVTFVSMGFGALLLLLTGLAVQGFRGVSPLVWGIIAWLAVLNTALAFTLWNRSLRVLSAVEATILNSLMMPQVALLAFLILGEAVSARQVLGLALVLVGVLVVQIRFQKR